MSGRISSLSNGRSGRRIGYDPNPKGLAGTSSNNRRLAGTSASASDYKKAKDKKEKDIKLKAHGIPYDDEEVRTELSTWSEEAWLKKQKLPGQEEPPEPERLEVKPIAEDEKDAVGGWELYLWLAETGKSYCFCDWQGLRGEKKAKDDGQKNKTETNDQTTRFFITDVTRDGNIKLPTSPLENGMVKHDHKVIMPKTVKITGRVKREDVYYINNLLWCAEASKSLGSYFSLSAPWWSFEKMYLSKYTSKADNRRYDVYDYTITLSQLLIAHDLKDKWDTSDDPELISKVAKGAAAGGGGSVS